MTCDDALVAMLSADLAALAPDHPGPLAHHVTHCARCRRVATQLRADSALLATAVARPTARAEWAPFRPVPWAVGALSAAVLLLVLGTHREPSIVPRPVPPVATTTGNPTVRPETVRSATPVQSRGTTPKPPRAQGAEPLPAGEPLRISPAVVVPHAIATAGPTMAVAFELPAPAVAVSLHPTPTLASAVDVGGEASPSLPPPSGDVTVLPTRVPGVTALWFN